MTCQLYKLTVKLHQFQFVNLKRYTHTCLISDSILGALMLISLNSLIFF